MHADAPKLAWDARQALERVLRFVKGKEFALIHGYASVDNRLVWGVVETHAAALHQAIRDLLEKG